MIVLFTQKLGAWGILARMRASLLLLCFLLSVTSASAQQLSARDYERVRAAVARGEMVPLADILTDAQRLVPGAVLEVELEDGKYEVEILGDDGVIRELEYDARTGELLEIEVEDD